MVYKLSDSVGVALSQITEYADKITNLDIAEDIPNNLTERKDEIGLLAISFQGILENFRLFAKQIMDTSKHLAVSSEELAKSSEESAVVANEVAGAIEGIAEGVTHQAMDTESASVEINSLVSNINNNNEYTGELAKSINLIQLERDGAVPVLEDLVEKTGIAIKSSDGAIEAVNLTTKNALNIQRDSESIRDISSQTNLLALNATIEAARAGGGR